MDLSSQVVSVEPEVGRGGGSHKWRVIVRDLSRETNVEEHFDCVVVCNGHYSMPNPDGAVKDGYIFGGDMKHSHDFRVPEVYSGKKVLVVGGSFSGRDIAIDVAGFADKVYMSHKGKRPGTWKYPGNLTEIPWISRCVSRDSFLLEDGSVLGGIDCVVVCTGYRRNFPFLSESCGVTVDSEDGVVRPLFKHVVNSNNPSMYFVGLMDGITFPLYDLQARVVLRLILGEVELPSRTEMDEDTEDEVRRRTGYGMAPKNFHRLRDKGPLATLELCQGLVSLGRVPGIPLETIQILQLWWKCYASSRDFREEFISGMGRGDHRDQKIV